VLDLPVQGNLCSGKYLRGKIKKSPESGEFGVVFGWTDTAPMRFECAQARAFLAVTGAVCGNVAGWVCIQLLAGE